MSRLVYNHTLKRLKWSCRWPRCTALALKPIVRLLYPQIEAEVAKNVFVRRLIEYGGIGATAAAQIVSQIADISRFSNNHHLAS